METDYIDIEFWIIGKDEYTNDIIKEASQNRGNITKSREYRNIIIVRTQ